jgi:hypothetical protein
MAVAISFGPALVGMITLTTIREMSASVTPRL